MAELVDALDSGSSGRTARGGSSPPFRTLAFFSLCVLVALWAAGCRTASTPRDRAREAVDALYDRLGAAERILEEHRGQQGAALWALRDLYHEHADDILAWRKVSPKLGEILDDDAKAKHTKRLDEFRKRIEVLVVAYPKPRPLLEAVSRLY